MTLDGFKAKQSSYRKLEMARGTLFTTLLLSLLVPMLFVAKRLDRSGFDSISVAMIAVSYALIAALMFFALARFGQKTRRELEGNCPGCGRFLLGKASRAVVATHHCPRCGMQLLR
jgi:cytochrome c biogenesis protein CcdA